MMSMVTEAEKVRDDESGMLVFGRGEIGITLAAHEGKGAMLLAKCRPRPIGTVEDVDLASEGVGVVLAFEDIPSIERLIGNLGQLKEFVLSGGSGTKSPHDILASPDPTRPEA